MARICRLYGVTPLLGRLYAVLFLSPGPLSLDELCEQVGAAKSSVSVALRKLLSVRVVRRLPSRGDRRDFYEVVADFQTVFADWNRLFLQPELAMWKASGDELEHALAAPDAPTGEDNARLRQRMEDLRGFADLCARFISRFSEQAPATGAARAIPIEVDDE